MNTEDTRVAREIVRLRISLRTLDKALGRLTPVLSAATKAQMNGAAKPGRSVSLKARASLVLQGRYMGFIRQLRPRQKVQVRKIREAKGVRVAIVRAKHLARDH
jgi:hypothetical protein